jgi:hypothetical protein
MPSCIARADWDRSQHPLTSSGLSCMCEHWRHKTAIFGADTVNIASTSPVRCAFARARARVEWVKLLQAAWYNI